MVTHAGSFLAVASVYIVNISSIRTHFRYTAMILYHDYHWNKNKVPALGPQNNCE